MLQVLDSDGPTIPVLSQILSVVEWTPKQLHNRTVLIKNDETVIRLPYSRNVDFTAFANPVYPERLVLSGVEGSRRVIATGNYDSCSQTLKINDPTA